MTSRAAGVLVLGSLNLDQVAHVHRLPVPGETLIAEGFETRPGGKGRNQAVAVAKLGGRVAIVGAVGADEAGTVLREDLGAHGVDTAHLCTAPAPVASGLALITVDALGENTIVVHPGANSHAPELPAEALAGGGFGVLLCSLEVPLDVVADATARARAAGLTTIVNAAPLRGLDDGMLAKVLEHTDILVVNESEGRELVGVPDAGTDELGRRLLSWRSATTAWVILTVGARGALILGADGRRDSPAPAVHATNSVGAGDTFAGALALALAAGRSMQDAAGQACAAGALMVSRPDQLSAQAVSELAAVTAA